MKNIKKKRGFTLIEVLIVVTIVALLSALAIGGYTSYRKSTLIDFTADSIISRIYELKDNAILGNYGRERLNLIQLSVKEGEFQLSGKDMEDEESKGARCFGLYYEDGEIGTFEMVYSGKKELKDSFFVSEGCIGIDGVFNFDIEPVETDELVQIEEVKLIQGNNESVLDTFMLVFMPPDGGVLVKGDGAYLNRDSLLEIIIGYGAGGENLFKRALLIDLNNLNLTKKLIKNE